MSFIDIILENPLAQTFGFLAMFVSFIGLLQKNDRNTTKIIMVSGILWVLHFYFMGIYSAMATSTVGIIRLGLSLKFKRNKVVFSGIIITLFTLAFLTYESQLSLLPVIGSTIATYGYFFLEGFRLRVLIFMSSVLWLTFGINTGSVGTILNEILAQLVLIFVMYKLIREQQQEISIFKKISNMFKKAIPDVGRFIYIYDYIRIVRNDLKRKIDSTLESLRIFSGHKKERFIKIKLQEIVEEIRD